MLDGLFFQEVPEEPVIIKTPQRFPAEVFLSELIH
jgi:hypothetical protein